jgi:hypothetical protein
MAAAEGRERKGTADRSIVWSAKRICKPDAARQHETEPTELPAALRLRQLGAVLADDARKGAQVPPSDRYRTRHSTPVQNTPVAAVWVSAERRIAVVTQAREHWH